MAAREADVLLAFMPFGNPNLPSLGLSLLKAGLKNRGISSKIAYYNLAFAKTIGLERCLLLSIGHWFWSGEWVFSQLAFGERDQLDKRAHDDALLKLLEKQKGARTSVTESEIDQKEFQEILIQIRGKAHDFVESCVDDIERINPKILGFSTISQNCSSLSVARRVKERLGVRAPIIVFGGSNCEGIMGYTLLKTFPWIDYVCCGEGDRAFVEFAENIMNGENLRVQGILGRDGDSVDEFSTPTPIMNMDELPFPDFGDYFAALRTLGIHEAVSPSMAIETSRGCWWGDKSHCIFCGLPGQTLRYRSKSADRVIRELDYLVNQWGRLSIEVVDNILDLDFFKSLFPALVRKRMKLSLLFETKSNLKLWQLKLLREAGIRNLQPGIESLSDDALRVMRKGVTGLQNIWLLKRCRETGIALRWNWLAGLPGEDVSEYDRMRKLVPLLHHLQPPMWFGAIHLDRFSPLFDSKEKFGIHHVMTAQPYRLIYPLDEKTLFNLAYYFDFEYENGRDPDEYTGELADEILKWMHQWNVSYVKPILPVLRRRSTAILARPILAMFSSSGRYPVPAMFGAPILATLDFRLGIMILDTRSCATRTLFFLKGLEAKILRYEADIRESEVVIQRFVELGYESTSVKQALRYLTQTGLMITDSGRCLSIAPSATFFMILAYAFGGCLRMLSRFMNLIHRMQPI